jgi:uncharacterized protein YkwD
LLLPSAPAALAGPAAGTVRTAGTAAGLLQAVNATRASHGLRRLRLDAALGRAARSHSADMLRRNVFAHGDFHGRMVAFRIRGGVAGENLAWGSGSYAQKKTIVAEWLASPEHRANLLRPGFTRIGIGVVRGSFQGSAAATVVTADFAG